VWVSITTFSPAFELSRVARPTPRPSTPLWADKCVVRLEPGETKTVALATDVTLPEGTMVTINMSDKDLTVMAESFSIPARVLLQQSPNQSGEAASMAP